MSEYLQNRERRLRLSTKKICERHDPQAENGEKDYLFSFHVTPSLVSFTSNPASAKASLI